MIELSRKLKGRKSGSAEISPSTSCAVKIFVIITTRGPAIPKEGSATVVMICDNVCRSINGK
jgi:hypothetical protein